MTKAATILALLTATATLQGCDWVDILTGKPTKAERNHVTIATQAEMHAHTQALLGGLYGSSVEPEPEAPAVVAEVVAAPEPVPVPAVDPGPPPFVCETIWRRQTCDEGVLYMLDSSGNWILPGRTE